MDSSISNQLNEYLIDSNFQESYDNLCKESAERQEQINQEEAKNKATINTLSRFSSIKKEAENPKETQKEDSKSDIQNPKEISRKRFNKGIKYLTGKKGYPRDHYKAFSLFKESAKLNNTQAQYNLGYLYLTGSGCQKSREKAVKWMTLAAANGNGNERGMKVLKAITQFPDPEKIQTLYYGWYPGNKEEMCNLF